MIFDVIQDQNGTLQLIEHGTTVPEGWTIVVTTSDANYLDYLATLA